MGLAVAVRVSGDPVADNNGLFYLYSDQLGSTSTMQHEDGRDPRQTRYTPFGDYRAGSTTNPITDRGYTGQKENMDLGLMYYNARYYIPSLGRFLSADTIVPDPANPQSYNRYSYTRNNPLNFVDPTGNVECALLGGTADIQACNVAKIPSYGITFVADEGEAWTEAQRIVALEGYADVDGKLRDVGGFMSSVTFRRSSETQWTGSDGTVRNIDYGARTFGRTVEFYDDAFVVNPLNPKFRNNVVHELGHVFNYNTVTSSSSDADPYAELGEALGGALPSRDTLRKGMEPYPLQQNTRSTKNENYELFADGFLNWTYDSFRGNTEGNQTSNWFDAQMSLWVSPSNP